jgi:hypothetical protein
MPPPPDERTTIMVDLSDLMDVADHDPHEQRLLAALERMTPDELLKVAAEAVRFGAQARADLVDGDVPWC